MRLERNTISAVLNSATMRVRYRVTLRILQLMSAMNYAFFALMAHCLMPYALTSPDPWALSPEA